MQDLILTIIMLLSGEEDYCSPPLALERESVFERSLRERPRGSSGNPDTTTICQKDRTFTIPNH